MKAICKMLYSHKIHYVSDEDEWCYYTRVLELPDFPSLYLELHEAYFKHPNVKHVGYALIYAGKIPEPSIVRNKGGEVVTIAHESGEIEVDFDNLGRCHKGSWTGGIAIDGIKDYSGLLNSPKREEFQKPRTK